MILLLLAMMFVLIALGFRIWAAMGISGLIYILIRGSFSLKMLVSNMVGGIDTSSLVAIPFFIFAGELMNHSGITKRLADFAEYFVGGLKGGLAYVAIIVNIVMAGVSGSAIADATAVASVMLPTMKERGYDRDFSAAINASAAVVGPIIPPSIPMIFLGVVSGLSIGKLFLGGVVPGLMMGLILMFMVFAITRRRGYKSVKRAVSFKIFSRLLRDSFLAIIAPLIIILGVVLGIVTLVEVAVLADVYILIISLVVYKSIKLKDVFIIAKRAVLFSTTLMILFAVVGVYQYIAASEQLDQKLLTLLVGWHMSKFTFLLLVNFFFLLWGCVMDAIPGILIFVPVLLPVAVQLGVDPIQFGVITVVNLMIGLLTPPIGGLLFLVSKISNLSFEKLVRHVTPYTLSLLLVLFLATYVPQLVLFVPRVVFGGGAG